MRYALTLFLTLLFTGGLFAQDTLRVLFLGNSYTYVNNLPQIVADMARSTGDSLIFASNTPGGYTLEGHSTNATSLSLIAQGGWNYVVLQEQSQLPSFTDSEVQSMVFPYARKLDSLINVADTCTETVFYMTWGRKNGDATNCAVWPPVCTYEGMDSLLYLRYMTMAQDNHAIVSPAGALWHYLRDNYPTLELYQADESHPSEAGSYATACAFYSVMYRKDPRLIAFDFTLSAVDAQNIRQAAGLIVYDSLMKWHVGEYDPAADFVAVPAQGNTISFVNSSVNACKYFWDFGDGQSSDEENPVHVYASGGNYPVSLIASCCTTADTMIVNVTASQTGIEIENSGIRLYPDPVADFLIIENRTDIRYEVRILNDLGQELSLPVQRNGYQTTIGFGNAQSGIYFIVLENDRDRRLFRVLHQ
ncbi:MAG: hypothetical protein CVU11_07040 [Bacteroidetes bacterium HGW-Bacteroidetes-6]|jgi:hypothetical protein|nr:MAG: hypothetical protein CVU11_07040 [Bacteroidetes bacterium HGW-Bacteroidetes-6]